MAKARIMCPCGSAGRAVSRGLAARALPPRDRVGSRCGVRHGQARSGGARERHQRPRTWLTRSQNIESSSSSSSPSTSLIALDNYTDIVKNMSKSVLNGLKDGLTRMEVEFPPVAEADAYKNSSDIYIDANVQFAIALGRVLQEYDRKIKILLPDENEVRRAQKIFGQALDMYDDISIGSVTGRGDILSDAFEGVKSTFTNLLDGNAANSSGNAADEDEVDTYVIVNVSCSELLDLKKFSDSQRERLLQRQGSAMPEGWVEYRDEKSGNPYYFDTKSNATTWERPVANEPAVILMNLELETLRGDLGLIAFPPKDMHYEFLSSFKSVYFIRQRDYSKTITESPFLVNYSGAIYREYPQDWQVLLEDTLGQRKYKTVGSSKDRYTLFQAKEIMMEAMGLKEDEGPALEFLRTGYKTCTWWEDPKDYDREFSDNWRK